MNPHEYILSTLKNFNDELAKRLDSKGMTTTGKAKGSLIVGTNGNNYYCKGAHYLEMLNTGRSPGTMPPVEAIEKWLDAKGLDYNPWAVAKNIAKKGTNIFRNRQEGLDIGGMIIKLRGELKTELPGIEGQMIQNRLREHQKKLKHGM